MSLGTEVGLSPGDFVLDGDPSPLPKKGTEPPIFSSTTASAALSVKATLLIYSAAYATITRGQTVEGGARHAPLVGLGVIFFTFCGLGWV